MHRLCLLLCCLPLVGCATPTTTLKHPATKQVVTCGGGTEGSFAGGMIGYHIQKDSDEECAKAYQKQGFQIIDRGA